jgi:hypothetical protein
VYVYRTHDYGKTWTKIVDGLPVNQPGGSFARVVRGDTRRAGLLFAGTESGMRVSFDDGDHWQSLMQNLPPTSYRDIAIKDNDLVVATFGRGFYALDDYSMLRQVAPAIASEPAHLFKPGDAVRVRRNVGADTPFPPEVPHALNPDEGVIIDYWLAQAPSRDITLDVLDSSGAVVRHMSSAPTAPVAEAARPPHPNFWVALPMPLTKAAGENRTHWDLRFDEPPAFSHSFEINANPGLTLPSPEGPLALPGVYTLKLTVDGRSYTQTVTVRPDPHSPASVAALRAQHALQMRIYEGLKASYAGHEMAVALKAALGGDAPELAAKLDTIARGDGGRGQGFFGGAPATPSFRGINGSLASDLTAQDLGDLAPTAATLASFASRCKQLETVVAAWERLRTTELTAFNRVLTTRGRAAVARPAEVLRAPKCM